MVDVIIAGIKQRAFCTICHVGRQRWWIAGEYVRPRSRLSGCMHHLVLTGVCVKMAPSTGGTYLDRGGDRIRWFEFELEGLRVVVGHGFVSISGGAVGRFSVDDGEVLQKNMGSNCYWEEGKSDLGMCRCRRVGRRRVDAGLAWSLSRRRPP